MLCITPARLFCILARGRVRGCEAARASSKDEPWTPVVRSRLFHAPPSLTARLDGVIRAQVQEPIWQPRSFGPVKVGRISVPQGPNASQ